LISPTSKFFNELGIFECQDVNLVRFNSKHGYEIPINFRGYWAFGKHKHSKEMILNIIPNFGEVPLSINFQNQKLYFTGIDPRKNLISFAAHRGVERTLEFYPDFIWYYPVAKFQLKDSTIELGQNWSDIQENKTLTKMFPSVIKKTYF